jgi:hypothetical protein
LGFLYWRFYLRRVASTEVSVTGKEATFDFCCHVPKTRKYTLSLRYSVSYTGRENHFGLVWYLQVTMDGKLVCDKVISAGYDTDHVKEIPEFTQTEYFASKNRRGTRYTRSATVVLAKLPRCRRMAEIAVTGKVRPAPDTEVNRLTLFVS